MQWIANEAMYPEVLIKITLALSLKFSYWCGKGNKEETDWIKDECSYRHFQLSFNDRLHRSGVSRSSAYGYKRYDGSTSPCCTNC